MFGWMKSQIVMQITFFLKIEDLEVAVEKQLWRNG
jgi:hypothetical protein